MHLNLPRAKQNIVFHPLLCKQASLIQCDTDKNEMTFCLTLDRKKMFTEILVFAVVWQHTLPQVLNNFASVHTDTQLVEDLCPATTDASTPITHLIT